MSHSKLSILRVCALLAFCVFQSAVGLTSEYMPVIRSDRVWECCVLKDGEESLKCLKFEGTEEINGRQYHQLVAFLKTVPSFNNASDKFDFQTHDVHELQGYMREENGLVYTLVITNNGRYGYTLYTSDDSLGENDVVSEELIYNFNVAEGEVVELLTFDWMNGYKMDFKVTSISSTGIENEDCKTILISPVFGSENGDGMLGPERTFIEGVGAAEYGCLNYTEFGYISTSTKWYNYLNRVFDMNGNVIYTSPSGVAYGDLQYGGFGSVKSINDSNEIAFRDDTIIFGNSGQRNSLAVFDISGKIARQASSSGAISLSVADLHPGIYIVTATANGSCKATKKVTVK